MVDSTNRRAKRPLGERLDQFVACWEGLEDPRTGIASLHDYHEMLVIALCTVLSGGQGATHMAAFAVAKEPFLRSFLKLEHGLPSHDTFSRVCFAGSIPSSSGAIASSASWAGLPMLAKASSRLMAGAAPLLR